MTVPISQNTRNDSSYQYTRNDSSYQFLVKVIDKARKKGLTSDKHFKVDGTPIEVRASVKSFQPKDDVPGTCREAKGFEPLN